MSGILQPRSLTDRPGQTVAARGRPVAVGDDDVCFCLEQESSSAVCAFALYASTPGPSSPGRGRRRQRPRSRGVCTQSQIDRELHALTETEANPSESTRPGERIIPIPIDRSGTCHLSSCSRQAGRHIKQMRIPFTCRRPSDCIGRRWTSQEKLAMHMHQ